MWVKLGKEEQRKEVMSKRRNLRDKRVRIFEDWIWRERRMRWKLEEIAREEEGKGNRVWVGYEKIRIDDQ